jgi:hypothetical protein
MKVVLYSSDGTKVGGLDFYKSFTPLTEKSDIIYNEFYNYVRNNGKKVKMVLTGLSTSLLDYASVKTYNPHYIRVIFEGIRSKNEISENKNIEFVVPTLVGYTYAAAKYNASTVGCQWINIPKSNKNIGVELESNEIFTQPFNIKILNNNSDVVAAAADTDQVADFMVEFWIFYDE